MRVQSQTEFAELESGTFGETMYVRYGELGGGFTSERLGHFLEEGQRYPETEQELQTVLESIIA